MNLRKLIGILFLCGFISVLLSFLLAMVTESVAIVVVPIILVSWGFILAPVIIVASIINKIRVRQKSQFGNITEQMNKSVDDSQTNGSTTTQQEKTTVKAEADHPEEEKRAFEQFYENHLKPVLKELEALRKVYLVEEKQLFKKPEFIVLIVLLVILLFNFNIGLMGALIIAIIGIPLFMGWQRKRYTLPKIDQYKQYFRKKVMPILVQFWGEGAEFKENTDFSAEELNKALLLPIEIGAVQGYGTFYGQRGGTQFRFSEALLKRKNSGNQKKPKTGYFKRFMWDFNTLVDGVLFQADFNKNFIGNTVLRPKKFIWAFFRNANQEKSNLPAEIQVLKENFKNSNKVQISAPPENNSYINTRNNLQNPETGSVLEQVKLEDPDFEALYDVYSTDQVKARYIFTPSFMELIKAFHENWGEEPFISFKDSTINIAIHYDSPVMKPDVNKLNKAPIQKEDLFHLYDEFYKIFGIVDELQLNKRIWG